MTRFDTPCAGAVLALLAGSAWLAAASPASAQADVRITPPEGSAPAHLVHDAEQRDGEARDAVAQRREAERELRKIRAKYFGTMRNVEVRQIGIRKMREFKDPALFPAMLEIFRREKEDVRAALLDHLAELAIDEADATLAWASVFDQDEWFRTQARRRLAGRVAAAGEPSWRVKTVVAQGLKNKDDGVVGQAAQTIEAIKLFEAIPRLINAQLGGGQAAGSGDNGSSLAYIVVGTQQAFVADLQPVVGESAVAFDPELAVVTEGTVLRVVDAVVVTYRTEVHNALVRLTSDEWGRSTAEFGYDLPRWRRWYAEEFEPFLAAKGAAPKRDGDGGPG